MEPLTGRAAGAESNSGSLYYARATHAQALNDRWAFKITGGAYTQDAFARPQGTIPNAFHTPYPPYTNKGTTPPKVDARVDYDHPDGKQHLSIRGGLYYRPAESFLEWPVAAILTEEEAMERWTTSVAL